MGATGSGRVCGGRPRSAEGRENPAGDEGVGFFPGAASPAPRPHPPPPVLEFPGPARPGRIGGAGRHLLFPAAVAAVAGGGFGGRGGLGCRATGGV